MLVRASVAALVALLSALPVLADKGTGASRSLITAVQPPAWLVESAVTTPIKPGLQVRDGDTLRTGAGGRVYIALPDHSTVKLGENTEFAAPAMDMMHDEQGSMFRGILHILKGVFRFTTSAVDRNERRHVDIRVGVATIGIRGTDVWGRTGSGGTLVALLEGKAKMSMPGHASMMMNQPMHYMMMPSGGGMKMNMPVTRENVADWAAQTDLREGAGVLTRGGRWTVVLASSTNPHDVNRLMRKLAGAGYPVEGAAAMVDGRVWHRLVIREAATYRDARALAASLARQYPSVSPRVVPTGH
ncbi:MAG: FecR domain-containing protein [Arenicellales bacterium]|jgi:hypothetical protein